MLSLTIARRFRKGRHKSGILSLISMISTLSIAIGIAALIIGLSAMNGFERELNQRVLSIIPHGELSSPTGSIENWQNIKRQLQHNKNITSIAPFVNFSALLENGNKLKAVEIRGMTADEQSFGQLKTYITAANWQSLITKSSQIFIGKGLAKTLSVKEGQSLTLLIPYSKQTNHQFHPPKRVKVYIAGIMDLSGSLGQNLGLINLKEAQQYLNLGDGVTGIMVNFNLPYQAHQLIQDAINNIDSFLIAKSWEQKFGHIYHDIIMIRQIMYIAMIVVISVACFSIISTLIIASKDKQRDIAILKTLGANNSLINHIFIFYGLLSGVTGGIIGVILGVIVSYNLSYLVNLIEFIFNFHLLNEHLYFVDFVPSEVAFSDVITVFITTTLLSLIASYYPAQRACKIDPVKILNGY